MENPNQASNGSGSVQTEQYDFMPDLSSAAGKAGDPVMEITYYVHESDVLEGLKVYDKKLNKMPWIVIVILLLFNFISQIRFLTAEVGRPLFMIRLTFSVFAIAPIFFLFYIIHKKRARDWGKRSNQQFCLTIYRKGIRVIEEKGCCELKWENSM